MVYASWFFFPFPFSFFCIMHAEFIGGSKLESFIDIVEHEMISLIWLHDLFGNISMQMMLYSSVFG